MRRRRGERRGSLGARTGLPDTDNFMEDLTNVHNLQPPLEERKQTDSPRSPLSLVASFSTATSSFLLPSSPIFLCPGTMNAYMLRMGGIFGFSAVALGAFGAHGLKNIISDQHLLKVRCSACDCLWASVCASVVSSVCCFAQLSLDEVAHLRLFLVISVPICSLGRRRHTTSSCTA